MTSSDRFAGLRNIAKSYNELVGVASLSVIIFHLYFDINKLPKNTFLLVTPGCISNLRFPIMNESSKFA